MVDFPIFSIFKPIGGWIKNYLQKKKLIKKAKGIVRRDERRIRGAKPIPHPPVSVEVLRLRIYENMLEELEELANGIPDNLMIEEVLELRRFIRESRKIPIPEGTFPKGMNFYDARFRELRSMKWTR
ncbi:MAG: hypothetical protein OXN90_02040 [Gemmatimonadota bacterium]|nr:hypothetical protein [Gemmatimonadota bacterium]